MALSLLDRRNFAKIISVQGENIAMNNLLEGIEEIWRIGLMGYTARKENVDRLLSALQQTLQKG